MSHASAAKKQDDDFARNIKHAWQLQTAKARFSELFRLVRSKGPQWVTRQGKEAVVLVPAEQFDELLRRHAGPRSLADFFAKSPLAGADVKFEREADYGRTIKL
jgi:prevent-host-death family protein